MTQQLFTARRKVAFAVLTGMMATDAAGGVGEPTPDFGHTVTGATASACGKTVDLDFADGGRYRFHAAWLRDSTTSNVGQDEYRLDPGLVHRLPPVFATAARPLAGGDELEVSFVFHGSEGATNAQLGTPSTSPAAPATAGCWPPT
mgnify:CR=1 FL=1